MPRTSQKQEARNPASGKMLSQVTHGYADDSKRSVSGPAQFSWNGIFANEVDTKARPGSRQVAIPQGRFGGTIVGGIEHNGTTLGYRVIEDNSAGFIKRRIRLTESSWKPVEQVRQDLSGAEACSLPACAVNVRVLRPDSGTSSFIPQGSYVLFDKVNCPGGSGAVDCSKAKKCLAQVNGHLSVALIGKCKDGKTDIYLISDVSMP